VAACTEYVETYEQNKTNGEKSFCSDVISVVMSLLMSIGWAQRYKAMKIIL